MKSPAQPRPSKSRDDADRLFARQEVMRHWPLWANGAALWVWLFLVPGPSTDETEVLRWSVLWTGLLAFVVAGDDLRRGIDPLVRGLALDGRRRWQMRTASVFLGGVLFYLMGVIATSNGWALALWRPLASGDFVDAAASQLPPFQPWQSMGMLAMVAVLGSLAAAHFHGMVMGLVYAGALWLASLGVAGPQPLLLAELVPAAVQSVSRSTLPDPHRSAVTLGVIAWIFAIVAWWVGSHRAACRAPIISSNSATSWLSVTIGILGAAALTQLFAGSLVSITGAYEQSIGHLRGAYGNSERWASTWMTLAWVESVFLMLWWWRQHRVRRATGGRQLTLRDAGWPGLIGGALALAHLAAQPTASILNQGSEVHHHWPQHLENLTVTSTQGWNEAYNRPNYTRPPEAYHVFIWSHYRGHGNEAPLQLESGRLPIPATPNTTSVLRLTLPGDTPDRQPTTYSLHLQRHPNHPTLPQPGVLPSDLTLKVFIPTESDPGRWVATVRLTANFSAGHFMPNVAVINYPARTHIAYAVTLLPERPDEIAVERSWLEIGQRWEGGRQLFPRKSTFPPGLYGLLEALTLAHCPTSLLLVPAILLAGVLLLHCRLGGPAVVGLAIALLITFIAADYRRIERQLAISGDPSRPEYQRELARARASISFFHSVLP